jgi:hypothetical protein
MSDDMSSTTVQYQLVQEGKREIELAKQLGESQLCIVVYYIALTCSRYTYTIGQYRVQTETCLNPAG